MLKLLLLLALAWAAWRMIKPKPRRRAAGRLVQNEADARALLGVGPDADAAAIRAAQLARRVNAARDLLLRRP